MQTFVGTVERFPGASGWHYVGVPAALVPKERRGLRWGFIPAECKVGATRWKASLLPKGRGQYFIAIKAVVRKKEGITLGDTITVGFWVR